MQIYATVVALVTSLLLGFALPCWWWWRRRAMELERQRDWAMKIAAAWRDGNGPEAQRLATEAREQLGPPPSDTGAWTHGPKT
jgi:hypothetical protein